MGGKDKDMNEFVKCLTKFAVAMYGVLAIVLLALGGLLLFAPKLLLTMLYYILIIGCIAGACYFLFCLVYSAYLMIAIKKGVPYECESKNA